MLWRNSWPKSEEHSCKDSHQVSLSIITLAVLSVKGDNAVMSKYNSNGQGFGSTRAKQHRVIVSIPK